jgi:NitT/TauT family transport system substrate-binding protein
MCQRWVLFLVAWSFLPGAVRAEDVIRVGYFPNLTHAVAMIGLERGFFAAALGPQTVIDAKAFNAGPAEMEALFAGAIDLGYVGPGPAITGFVRSKGKALRVVSGAAMGGASLIVRPDAGVERAADLAGKRLASPQIGNTQDVALRTYLREAGLGTSDHGGTVTVLPVANADILTLVASKQIDGAWVPEPWASVLRLQAGGKELVDERSLWPDGKFPTTVVMVSTAFLAAHRPLVTAWLRGQSEAVTWLNEHPTEAKRVINETIRRLTTRDISPAVLDEAWGRLTFSSAVQVDAFDKMAKDAQALGYLPTAQIQGLFEGDLEKAFPSSGSTR